MMIRVAMAALLLCISCVTEPCDEVFVECTTVLGGSCRSLENRKRDGYDCRFVETIRNAFGGRIGTRWSCEKC